VTFFSVVGVVGTERAVVVGVVFGTVVVAVSWCTVVVVTSEVVVAALVVGGVTATVVTEWRRWPRSRRRARRRTRPEEDRLGEMSCAREASVALLGVRFEGSSISLVMNSPTGRKKMKGNVKKRRKFDAMLCQFYGLSSIVT